MYLVAKLAYLAYLVDLVAKLVEKLKIDVVGIIVKTPPRGVGFRVQGSGSG